ncbi:MAG: HAMP domain-containing protein [Candidatus Hydrogenedentes bacterium]|nr:HAMP domain-containing protein [Candidatus Hydrogenedentota bacterium]
MALSVPIFLKVLGIGFLVTLLFGAVAFHQISVGMFRTHYQVHGETALSITTALAGRIAPLLAGGRISDIDKDLAETMSAFPDVRYVIVQAPDRRIISHGFAFPKEVPSDLLANNKNLCMGCHDDPKSVDVTTGLMNIPPSKLKLGEGHIRAYQRREGLVLEAWAPVADGQHGTVRLGVGDRIIAKEIASISRSLFWSLALCVAVGLSLALVLTYAIVRPVHNLVQTTNQIREGDFQARADVFSQDEIGQLSLAFNQMAEGLESYRDEVREKEAVRLSLLARIVEVQEEERKSIARELHDQLGQSLSTTLLSIEALGKEAPEHSARFQDIKNDIRGIIDEVRRIAWHARPSILDDYGLDQALARYSQEISRHLPFTIDYQYVARADAPRLPNPIEVTLYRIAQEGCTNIIRHAHASQASLILLRHDHEVHLVLEDDGNGFDVQSLEKGVHPPLGLIGIRERVALVGGEFTVDSSPGKGTTLRVRIPLGERDDAGSAVHTG